MASGRELVREKVTGALLRALNAAAAAAADDDDDDVDRRYLLFEGRLERRRRSLDGVA